MAESEDIMREYTRFLKDEAKKDISKIYSNNNSKERNRSAEQNAQSLNDKANFYKNKWTDLILKAETPAQKNICWDVLERVKER